ncbi:hypothetical protein J8F10_21735 [Gemmata sp. G18]|uniref:Uncharacterized protein n=1 Tax=Gemmata palustris TaxID=2822762 RepID=A0ABS5BVZ8_9BACT|nr:hypothetical protein [Gemmata palustris]MBP3957884.1 hypothetical protein [Gemmata palustris]
MGWLAKLVGKLRGTPSPPRDPDATFERLVWLEPHENPFGVRVLDCRPIAETFLSASQDAASIRFFGSLEARSGEQFRGQRPEEPVRVACGLAYPRATPFPEGPVFLAGTMEEKWNIYHFAGVLYFARSWTGHLQYTATLAPSPSELQVVEVEAWPGNVPGDDAMAVRQVDFLLRSHVLGQVVPHPAPPLPSKKGIALWSFSQYGRRGLYAAVEGVVDGTAEPSAALPPTV